MSPNAATRPGKPEAPGWKVLLFLAGLFTAGAAGWGVVFGVGWLVWAYSLVGLGVVFGLGVAALGAWLIWRAVR